MPSGLIPTIFTTAFAISAELRVLIIPGLGPASQVFAISCDYTGNFSPVNSLFSAIILIMAREKGTVFGLISHCNDCPAVNCDFLGTSVLSSGKIDPGAMAALADYKVREAPSKLLPHGQVRTENALTGKIETVVIWRAEFPNGQVRQEQSVTTNQTGRRPLMN